MEEKKKRRMGRRVRERFKEQRGGFCYICGSDRHIEYHHLIKWDDLEDPTDPAYVIPLCHKHHMDVEYGIQRKRKRRGPGIGGRKVTAHVDGYFNNVEAAQYLGVSVRWIQKMAKDGRLKVDHKVKLSNYYLLSELERFKGEKDGKTVRVG